MTSDTLRTRDSLQRSLPAIGAAIRNIIIFTAVLSIPLSTAQTLELSPAQTSSWILALYGLPSLLSLILAFYYRQPIQLTGNIFVIIFISRLGDQLGYPELVGAAILPRAWGPRTSCQQDRSKGKAEASAAIR
jgi:benzoate membrane transport protein